MLTHTTVFRLARKFAEGSTLFNSGGQRNYECMRVRVVKDLDDVLSKSLGYGLGFRMDLELYVNVTEME